MLTYYQVNIPDCCPQTGALVQVWRDPFPAQVTWMTVEDEVAQMQRLNFDGILMKKGKLVLVLEEWLVIHSSFSIPVNLH